MLLYLALKLEVLLLFIVSNLFLFLSLSFENLHNFIFIHFDMFHSDKLSVFFSPFTCYLILKFLIKKCCQMGLLIISIKLYDNGILSLVIYKENSKLRLF